MRTGLLVDHRSSSSFQLAPKATRHGRRTAVVSAVHIFDQMRGRTSGLYLMRIGLATTQSGYALGVGEVEGLDGIRGTEGHKHRLRS